jgi:Icc protein
MNTSRRSFLRKISLAVLLVSGGGIKYLSAAEANTLRKKVMFRFAVASDGHYGQPNTAYDDFFSNIVKAINSFHQQNPLQSCFINGDIIHNKKEFLLMAKQYLNEFKMPYYVSKGNHDMVNDEYWREVWETSPNHTVVYRKTSFIIANTSNEGGDYLSPDLVWLKEQLEISRNQKNVFLVLHIPQAMWTDNAVDTPEFFELIKNYKNIKAVFHGHEHDQDGVKMHNNIPFLFDSHFGGGWGTSYKGFRVVEVMNDNSILTYVMNPSEKLNELVYH